jgi:hypothetical protein
MLVVKVNRAGKGGQKDTQTVVSALIKQAKKLPTELYKSLTWDRGKESKAPAGRMLVYKGLTSAQANRSTLISLGFRLF